MCLHLDFLGLRVDVVGMSPSSGISEETTNIGVHLQFAGARALMPDGNPATKCMDISEVWDRATGANDRHTTVSMRHNIMQHNVMVKCIGPELERKARTMEHGAQGMSNGLMGPLSRGILVRSITAGGPDNITMKQNQGSHFLVVGDLAPLIHTAVFVCGITWGVLTQPAIDPCDCWTLAVGGKTPQHL
jgi:hypothetical protein